MSEAENLALQTEHEHAFEPILLSNPDLFFRAYRGDIVIGYRCTSCPHIESSQGWNGEERIRRNELCECCDGVVEKKKGCWEAQDMGRFAPTRVIYQYKCKDCGHEQYYYEDED